MLFFRCYVILHDLGVLFAWQTETESLFLAKPQFWISMALWHFMMLPLQATNPLGPRIWRRGGWGAEIFTLPEREKKTLMLTLGGSHQPKNIKHKPLKANRSERCSEIVEQNQKKTWRELPHSQFQKNVCEIIMPIHWPIWSTLRSPKGASKGPWT